MVTFAGFDSEFILFSVKKFNLFCEIMAEPESSNYCYGELTLKLNGKINVRD